MGQDVGINIIKMLIIYLLTLIINTPLQTLPIKKQNLMPPYREYLRKGEFEKININTTKDTFLLAELMYFNYEFENAIKLYKKISPSSPDCNDALYRIELINGNTKEDLTNYVNAELLYRNGTSRPGNGNKMDEAIKLLKKLKLRHSSINLFSYILFIDILESKKNYKEAINECKEFLIKFEDNPKTPEILMKEGTMYEKIGNKKEAIKIYNQILVKYPKSPISALARLALEE
ncbi:MAG: tetratricopeptide repeat protein [bacterium]|nr:tetratricopeptide repeat protein [bacterium]